MVGFRPKPAREAVNEWHSDATKEAQRKFQEAEGLGGKFKAAVENPSNIVGAVVESLPAMGAGGVAARALGAATRLGQAGAKGAAAAGALGEGIVGAGSAAEQIRQETDDGLLSPGQAAAAAATGAATAGFGYAGGRMAQRLGIGDAETMLAQGNQGIAKQFADDAATAATNPLLQQRAVKSIPRQVIEGAISEGFLEELPQSVAEQIFQNLALGKDWSQDVDTAVVLGTLSGAAMGGGAAGYRAAREPRAGAAEAGQAVDAAGQEDRQAAPDVAGAPVAAAAPAPGAAAESDAPVPNPGLDAVRREFDARMSQLQQEEGGEPEVPQSAPPDGAAALAQQRAAEQDRRDAESAANRAVESPDDEILQSTGAAPLSPSRAMGLDPAAGSLSAAAALAVDSGASAQAQQATALAQAAEEAARAPAKKKATERQVTADPATGEIQGGAMATWTDEDLSNAFRSAQAKNVRLQLARELSRRRAERDQQTPATAPAASANPSTQQGSIDGTQADQAQPPRAESSQAAGAQGAPVAGPGPAQELTNGTTSSQHDGAQAGAAPGPQAQAPVQTPAQRIDAGRAAWASMPTVERKALAKRVGGVNAAIKGSLHGARWENLNAELQLRLADAMQPQGATNDSTAPAVRLADERPPSPAAAAEAGGGEPTGRAPDAQSAGPRGGVAGHPAAGMQPAVPGRSGTSEQAAAVASAAAPAPTAGQQQAVAIVQQGSEARREHLLAASERWTSMPVAERQAVAKAAKGLNALARASSHTRAWADLAPKVREKLAAAMPDAAAAPAAPAATPSPNAPVRYQGKDADKIGPAIVAVREHTNGQIDKAALIERLRPLGLTDAQVQSVTYKLGDEFSMEDVRAVLSSDTSQVDTAAHEAATSERNDRPAPTEAQKEAGNYKKGHVRLNGLDISIENPAGSRRRPEWPPLQNHYGYFKGSVGADKDHVDVFMTDRASDPELPVFVVDQVNRDGSFDEHKVVLGAADEADARATYLGNYEKGWTGLGAVTQMTQDEFKAWVRDAAKTKKPAGTLPGAAPAPASNKPRGVLAKKAAAEEAARADYFTPGNIVKGYGDSHVRVVSYTPANADGVWSVTVRQVEKQGSGWQDVPGVRERTHATQPSARELKAGPVERTEELPFRRGEADGQGLTDDQMANLLRIMRPEPTAFSNAARAQAVGQVRETVDAIRKGWSNGPEVVVAFDMNDPAVPDAARRADLRQRSGGATGAPEGFYWRGKAYLLASKLNTPADAARVLHHEVLGHHGLRGMFGPELNKILNQVAAMRQAEVAAKIKEYGLRGVTDLSRRHAAEEVLAEMAEKTPQLHFVRRAVAAIRNWLRANVPGFGRLKLSDADIIQGYILPARDFVERGQRTATDRIEPVFSRSDSAAAMPDAIIGSTLGSASKHPDYAAAKGGDVAAATRLAVDLVTPEMAAKVAAALGGARPRVLPVAAEESSGRNKIPRAVAEVLAARLGLETATGIVQANRAQRTGLDGLDRIFAPVDFSGTVEPGDYLLVDDTLTQGGTFAALASHIREGGGNVVGVVALTGKQYSAKIQPSPETLASLRQKHGDLEDQFRAATGYGFDALTESEARYLARFEPAERLRDRIAEEGRRAGERADQSNPRQGDAGDELSFSRSRLSEIKDSALDQLQKTMSHPGKVSVWDKTIGTMRHLAERAPAFKPVYETAQRNIDDVSMLANDAADRAPRLLPRVDTISDLVGKNRKTPVSAADNKAVAKPLFEGTLLWGRDVNGKAVLVDELAKKYGNLPADDKAQLLLRAGRLDDRMLRAWRGLPLAQYEALVNSRFESKMLKAGAVWTDAELQTMFGATPNQMALYREARAAIDRSIDMTARADMMRALGDEYAGLRDMVLDAPKLADALELLTTTLQEDAKAKPDMAERLLQLNNMVVDRAATAKDLQDGGYAPLSRFGRYTLDVVDQEGNRQYFGMYESMKDANLAKIQMAQAFPGAVITQGTMSQQSFKLFAGITPETLEIFKDMVVGKEADAATRKVFDEYLKLTKNNHSALKRLIQRKGIEGYSQDVGRVVANFIYSNARQGAAGLNAGTMDRAINDIPKEQGELKDLAMGLRSYIRDPQEEGQAVRGMLFAQYLGGSLASAVVNMTQPFAVTLPWLSQFGGIRAASGQMARALKDMGTRGMKYEPDLAHALKSAEDDGVVSPQEVHQLMAQARGAGGLRSGDGTKSGDARAAAGNAWERAKVAWGQPFALAEQFNRRSTFIAAFRIAKAQGMDDPGAFARKAVLETQFVYSKANKPQWARGAVGGTLFTFKTYSVSYLELMQRMWKQGGPEGKRAVGWALAMLLLMGGAGGVPFMEDAEDLIDGVGQMMGYNLSSKQWRKEALAGIVGKELAEFLEQGVSGLPGAPIDVSGRLGMGNLLPGTGLLLTKQSRERDLLEVAGPAGDLVMRGFTAGRKVLTGDVAGAALEVSPTAVRNAFKGADMAASGMYKDTKGYKVIDTTLAEAVAKAVGFQPKSVAEIQEANSFMQRSKSFYSLTSSEIKAQWADALFRKDEEALARVRERLADWNQNNPEQPIVVKMPDIWKKVREMGKDRTDRIADNSPKALRQQMREMAAEAR
ncbi:PLxRFG domain-containing protein [Delftia tsuruhatensis]|uniref:PLxRFG domain-containing protein n=1 Tax=Delftia tsuruhatensis TaxID=180282 RepID=UPI002443CB62|nr:PLxRFG domain-containing protein [Delftia tsuruhatensis]MDH0774725.1 PLxRFG domain-containing protein [Delftia tsuruhatensis]MDH1458789.1 PLxRFG domain-containing protein [Delftia tsuruhatensis]MDH1826869.1 PLxRFG domain-containing protein [Delftia tsuruhatensis]WGG09406.1 PLxRFG domain-containing protein [Delftia tsuruhatensis]